MQDVFDGVVKNVVSYNDGKVDVRCDVSERLLNRCSKDVRNVTNPMTPEEVEDMLSSSSCSDDEVVYEEMIVEEREDPTTTTTMVFKKNDGRRSFGLMTYSKFHPRNGEGKDYEENWQLRYYADNVSNILGKNVSQKPTTTIGLNGGFYSGDDSENRLNMLKEGFKRTGHASIFMTESQLQKMFKDRLTEQDVKLILEPLPRTYVSTYFKRRNNGNNNGNDDGFFGKRPIFYLTEVIAYLEKERPEQIVSHRKGGVSPKMTAFLAKCNDRNVQEESDLKRMHASRIAKAMGADPEENARLARTMCHTEEDRATFVSSTEKSSKVPSLQLLCIDAIVKSGLAGGLNADKHLSKPSLDASLNDGLAYVKSFLWPMEVPSFDGDDDAVLNKMRSFFEEGRTKGDDGGVFLKKEDTRRIYDELMLVKLDIPSKNVFYQLFAQRCVDECLSAHFSEETTCDLGLTEEECDYLFHFEERDATGAAKLLNVLEKLNTGKYDFVRFFICSHVAKMAGFDVSHVDTDVINGYYRNARFDARGLSNPSTSTLRRFLENVVYWKNPNLVTDDGRFLDLNEGCIVNQRAFYKRAMTKGFYKGDLKRTMGRSCFKACDDEKKKGLNDLLSTYNTPERYMLHVVDMIENIFGLSLSKGSGGDDDKNVYFKKNNLVNKAMSTKILYLPTHITA